MTAIKAVDNKQQIHDSPVWSIFVQCAGFQTNVVRIFKTKTIEQLLECYIEQTLWTGDVKDVIHIRHLNGTILNMSDRVCDLLHDDAYVVLHIKTALDNTDIHKHVEEETEAKSMHFSCGDHVCWMVDDEKTELKILTDFIIEGIELNHKVIFVSPTNRDVARTSPSVTTEKIQDALRKRFFELEKYESTGQLVFVTTEAVGLDNSFDPQQVIDMFRAAAKEAILQGYKALRATGDRCWTLQEEGCMGKYEISQSMLDRVVKYETDFSRLCEEYPNIIGLCRYDRKRFSETTLDNILAIHPQAAVNGDLYDNFYYIPPSKFATGNVFSQKVTNLETRKRMDCETTRMLRDMKIAYKELEHKLERAFENNEVTEHMMDLVQKQRAKFIAQMSHEIRSPLNGIIASGSLLSHVTTNDNREIIETIETSTRELLHILNRVLDPDLSSHPLTLPDLTASATEPFSASSPLTLPCPYSTLPSPASHAFQPTPFFLVPPSPSTSPNPPSILENLIQPLSPIPPFASLTISSSSSSTLVEQSDDSSPAPLVRASSLSSSLVSTTVSTSASLTPTAALIRSSSSLSTSSPSIASRPSPFAEICAKFPRLLNILVVDDNSTNVKVLERMLGKMDRVVWKSVTNGLEAVEESDKKMYDVILMDLYMPVMNGIEASREILIRSRTRARKPVIVAVTASVTEEIKKECLEDVGMVGFITKPINVPIFAQIFTSILPLLQE